METTTLIKVDTRRNSNKFYKVSIDAAGNVTSEYGRVGYQGRKGKGGFGLGFYYDLIGQKKAKGYREIRIADGPDATDGKAFEDLAVRQIAGDNDELAELVRYLVKENVHNILDGTKLTYNTQTGQFSTPLGLVDTTTIQAARSWLNCMRSHVANPRGVNFQSCAEEYMTLIPQDTGMNRPDVVDLFGTHAKLDRQEQILDGLEAALAAADVTVDGDVFNVDMGVVEPGSKKWDWIVSKHENGKDRTHPTAHMKVKRIWWVSLKDVDEAFEQDGAKLDNQFWLWHGTKTANVLSILSKGLVKPRSATHGWMFGPGLYFAGCSTKSLNYSYGSWSGTSSSRYFAFVAKVAMGETYEAEHGDIDRPPAGHDSIWGRSGKTRFDRTSPVTLQNDEMIVYRTSQARLGYLVEFE